jgi:hypothetical protein
LSPGANICPHYIENGVRSQHSTNSGLIFSANWWKTHTGEK